MEAKMRKERIMKTIEPNFRQFKNANGPSFLDTDVGSLRF
jgi:hypothetical protein